MGEKAVYTNSDTLEKNISKETYDLFAKKTKNRGLNPKQFEKFINEINQGNIEDEFNKKFLDERNKNMAEKIRYYLNNEDGRNYFVVIGSAHLIGDTGIIKLLKEKGYNVRQIINKNIGTLGNNLRFSISKIK
jgi:uncharacterized protein YbaP (TraB family)